MRKLLAGFAVVGMLAIAGPAQAATFFTQNHVNKNNPMTVEFANTDGFVNVDVSFDSGDGPVNLSVTGPGGAACQSQTSFCFIDPAPNGTYSATVSVDSGNYRNVTITTDE
jgi:hypothetical protein